MLSGGIAKREENQENLKNVADFEEEKGLFSFRGKDQEMKNSQGKRRELKKEIEKGEFEGLIIDRSQSQQEVDTQIDRMMSFERKKAAVKFMS